MLSRVKKDCANNVEQKIKKRIATANDNIIRVYSAFINVLEEIKKIIPEGEERNKLENLIEKIDNNYSLIIEIYKIHVSDYVRNNLLMLSTLKKLGTRAKTKKERLHNDNES